MTTAIERNFRELPLSKDYYESKDKVPTKTEKVAKKALKKQEPIRASSSSSTSTFSTSASSSSSSSRSQSLISKVSQSMLSKGSENGLEGLSLVQGLQTYSHPGGVHLKIGGGEISSLTLMPIKSIDLRWLRKNSPSYCRTCLRNML